MEGETDIRELEFYVTVEYYKTKKHTTSNVEIKNPSPTENKKPSQPTAIKKAKGSPAEHKPRSKKEEKGVFRSISETIDEIWDWAETQGTAQRDKPHTIEIPEGKSPAVIGKTKVEKKEEKKAVGKCPNCNKEITIAELRQIFLQADQITLTKVAATYNKYMKELGMNTCWNKAHFFAQARIESGAGLHVKNGENFNWYWEKLISEFSAFKTPEGKINAKQWGRVIMDRTDPKCVDVSKENQKKIANWAYSYKFKKGKELGNTQENDGWNFRGKGLLQLTGRKAYAYANTYTQKEGADIITNPDLVISDVSIAVLSSMAFWKWKDIGKLTKGKTNTKEICIQVGKDIDGNHSKKQKVFTESTSKVFKTDTCALGKHIKNDNSSTYDCAYKADSKTAYIDIIVPSNRKKEGLMVIFDNTGILFKCYALALGTGGEDRYTNGGYGNVPNGLWSNKLELNTPNTGVSFGNHGVIRLSPLAGDSLKASSRKGILIHCGHTMGDGKYGLTDNGPLMVTHGCIRVYNKYMPKITDIYEELTKNNKIIC
ncbi:hypothetical protein INQ45_09960 [Flavobacterium columnare]|uniref:glycoside hydrolase family 19 protein n=1 Tax=Flavobacterium columnare TaxID=996 RepID=UPI002D210153|nr:hypothetical protein [Flavobacterium columnare]MEB3801367.1 hypothetical protein [Flavobacterium columnare]